MDKKTILVTGANRGIGLATVEALAENPSHTVLLGSRNLEQGQIEADKLGENVHAVHLDIASPDLISKCMQEIENQHGNIDVLINNAGLLKEGPILESDLEGVMESFQINTFAPIQLIKSVLPSMVKNNYGRIVNVSSGWGSFDEGLAGPFAYSTSKAALNAVTLTSAQGLPSNVKINSACPGWVRTRMGGMMAPRSTKEGAQTLAWLATLPEDGPTGGFFRDEKLIEW